MRARDNPLTVQRLERLRYRITEANWSSLLQRLSAHHYRGAIVGPEGHGKTTLLRDLSRQLQSAGWDVRSVRLRRGQGWLNDAERQTLGQNLHQRALLCVDGVDELSAVARWRLRRSARAAGGLIVAAHREGFLPTLWRCETSPELLSALLAELGLSESELPGTSVPALIAKHGGDLRAAFSTLYDEFARLPDAPRIETGATAESSAEPMLSRSRD